MSRPSRAFILLVAASVRVAALTPGRDADCSGKSWEDLTRDFHASGYVILRPCAYHNNPQMLATAAELTTRYPLRVREQIENGRGSSTSRHQFEYTGAVTRRFEQDGQRHLWQQSRAVFDIVTHEELLRFLAALHGGVPVAPVQSNNFYIGSMTPPHSGRSARRA